VLVHYVVQRVHFGDRLQAAIVSQHVHPLGKEQVDLRVVLLQRGEAGGVPLHVERAADAFVGVQNYLRGRLLGLAMRVDAARRLALLVGFQRVIRLLDFGQRDAWDRRSTQDGDYEKNQQQGNGDDAAINDEPQTAPAFTLGIEKDLLGVRHCSLLS
jgi:hypothetical protein